MTTQLVLLGTAGGPTPKKDRSAPAQAIVVDGRVIVVDCGNGITRRLVQAGIPFTSIDSVLITHHHSDHNADLGNLFLLGWAGGLSDHVQVLGPPPLGEHLEHFFAMQRFDIETRILDEGRPDVRALPQVTEVTEPGVLVDRPGLRISCARVNHPPIAHALAYRIDTTDRSIVISGDTTPCDELVELARGADLLVHEVIHTESLEATLARSNGTRLLEHLVNSHTRVQDVGKLAEQAGVGTLVLSHLVPSDDSVPENVWVEAAREGFSGEVVLGRDLMVL
ncbi:MBL fold metallo-hydrolase [Enemella evansiae]|uniref:MBL fold metallo-hydrolase n=1 Tax=Enemella evansiae TaxID=2016499 RepID=UPI000B97B246|nr:MBL fold metallo-hydrolase [Enemella evansiae]OYN99791.1 MBL fold metallo-hydrolase [Enemella evansiae]